MDHLYDSAYQKMLEECNQTLYTPRCDSMSCPTEQISNYEPFQQSMIQNSLGQSTMQTPIRQQPMQSSMRHPATMQSGFKDQSRCSAKPGSCMCSTCMSKYTSFRPSMQHERERSQLDTWKMKKASERNQRNVMCRETNDSYYKPYPKSEQKVTYKEESLESLQEKSKYSAVTQTPVRETQSNWCQVTKSVCDSMCTDESACSLESAETEENYDEATKDDQSELEETPTCPESSEPSQYSKPESSRYQKSSDPSRHSKASEPSQYSKVSEPSHYSKQSDYQATSHDASKYKQSTCGSSKSKKSYPDKTSCYDTENRAYSKVSKENPSEHSNNQVQDDGYQMSHPRSDSIKQKQSTNSDKNKERDEDEIEKIYGRSKDKPSEKFSQKYSEKSKTIDPYECSVQTACVYQTSYQSSKTPNERKCRCKYCCSREKFVERTKFSSFNNPTLYIKDEPQESFSYRTAANSEQSAVTQRSRSKSKSRPSVDIEKPSRDKTKVSSHNTAPKLEVSVNEASVVRQDSTKQNSMEVSNRSRNSSVVKGAKEKSFDASLVKFDDSFEEKHVCRPMSPLNIVLNLHLNLKPENFKRNENQ